MAKIPLTETAGKIARHVCDLNRHNGGDMAWRDLLAEYKQFEAMDLPYPDGNGPPMLYCGGIMRARFIVTAHYDSIGGRGACDNASGMVACILLASLLVSNGTDHGIAVALLPREEPPYYLSDKMGSLAMRRLLGDGWAGTMIAVDTIGGVIGAGQRRPELCGSEAALRRLPPGFLGGMVVNRRQLHHLSDARNFPGNGILLTDERVLSVPMHSRMDVEEDVDWGFVAEIAQHLFSALPGGSKKLHKPSWLVQKVNISPLSD